MTESTTALGRLKDANPLERAIGLLTLFERVRGSADGGEINVEVERADPKWIGVIAPLAARDTDPFVRWVACNRLQGILAKSENERSLLPVQIEQALEAVSTNLGSTEDVKVPSALLVKNDAGVIFEREQLGKLGAYVATVCGEIGEIALAYWAKLATSDNPQASSGRTFFNRMIGSASAELAAQLVAHTDPEIRQKARQRIEDMVDTHQYKLGGLMVGPARLGSLDMLLKLDPETEAGRTFLMQRQNAIHTVLDNMDRVERLLRAVVGDGTLDPLVRSIQEKHRQLRLKQDRAEQLTLSIDADRAFRGRGSAQPLGLRARAGRIPR